MSYYSTEAEDRRVEKGQIVRQMKRQNFSNVINNTLNTCTSEKKKKKGCPLLRRSERKDARITYHA